MEDHLLTALAAVLVLGVAGAWIAWRLRLPSILVLLTLGFIAGPVSGFLETDAVFGDLLLPLVSLSVGVILFEGGLSLKLRELREIGGALRNLISLGAALTWLLTAAAAWLLGGLDLALAILLGAILVVTGPTVILPMLRDIRPSGRVATLLKWEGIVIDPLGAALAVLAFEAVVATEQLFSVGIAAQVVILTVIIGGATGLAGAWVVYQGLRRYWVPDYLHNPFVLTIVVAVFALANLLQSEAGLLATTVMGVVLTNQRDVPMKRIAEFKEDLQVLLISSLFILLTSRLPRELLTEFTRPSTLGFLAFVILIVRPASVWASTLGSRLNWRERVFLSWMAPRGIVAAAVSAIFAIRLIEGGYAGAERLTLLAFVTIAGTVTVYSLTAPPLARLLSLADTDPQGFLVLGGHAWARRLALGLQKSGARVLVLDSNYSNVRQARMSGLETTYGSGLSQSALEDFDLAGIGRLLALTPNDEVNALACLHFREVFGRVEVHQIAPPASDRRDQRQGVSTQLRGRLLFGQEWTYQRLNEVFSQQGTEVKVTRLTESFGIEDLLEEGGSPSLPIVLKRPNGKFEVFSADQPPQAKPGDVVLSLAYNQDPSRRFT